MANADRIIELLFEAKARLAGAEREQFLAEACRDNAALREQIRSLLQAEADDNGSFLRINQTHRPTILPAEKAGDWIGRYKLLEQIGEGGCGVVYMAEQEEPVRRRVALKVIKLGMDTKQVIARFEAERQALAMMDHPNIAKVLDGGATDTGRPFFVMELVRGIKITDYCDQNNLSTNERLELFIQVCQAVQHAHQKGIIHRDIKPSNILVTQHDDTAVPKVIDFGIAKATTGQLTDKTVFTAFAQFIGTPAYMSPEQAQMSGLDIDTRADIYSLGVLLYELLTGNTPFDAKELLAAGMDEMRRKIREDEPAKPSTRLSTMQAMDLTTVARRRHVESPRLHNLVRGDLDWLVMKCLEKDRTRRYETANALAMDVQRHLDNEPVTARPPSGAYRFQKLVRRNKGAFAAATAITVVLVLGVIFSTWQAVRATRAEREQVRLRHEAEQAQDRETKLREEAEIRERAARARFLLDSGAFPEAERLLNGLTLASFDANARNVEVLHVLSDWNVAHGRWKEAADALDAFLKLGLPDDGSTTSKSRDLVRYGCLLLAAGNTKAYEDLRSSILNQPPVPQDYLPAFRIAQLGLIRPTESETTVQIGRYVSKVRASPAQWQDGRQWEKFLFALFEHRMGNYAESVANGQDATNGSPSCAACAFAVLAASHQRLSQPLEARAALAQYEGLAVSNSNRIKKLDPFWQDWMVAEILYREARALVEGQADAATK